MLDREASGIVHLLLNVSLQATPLAALSRPVAGTIKNTLVVTLPGSVKAVQENIAALLNAGVVNHAIELIRGGSGQRVHSALAAEGIRIAGEGSVASPGSAGLAPPISPAPSQSPNHHHHAHGHSPRPHVHDHGHVHHSPKPRSVLSHDPALPGRPYWKQVEPRAKRSASSPSSSPPSAGGAPRSMPNRICARSVSASRSCGQIRRVRFSAPCGVADLDLAPNAVQLLALNNVVT